MARRRFSSRFSRRRRRSVRRRGRARRIRIGFRM